MGKHDKKDDTAENIKVIVRCRPLNSKEKESGYKSCVDLDISDATVTVNHVMGDPDRWTFDAVVNNTLTQRDIFVQFIAPMIDSVMSGFNATVFAYGQSGSGKTHTMTGVYDDETVMGIIPRTFRYVFNQARQDQETHPGRKYQVSCSFVELYNNKIRDLLSDSKDALDVKENKDKSFYVKGAKVPFCKTVNDLISLIEEGTARRQVASTELNQDSSRSHSIFSLLVEMVETSEDGDVRAVTSKLNLVDLAGSERISKTGATGDTLKEGCNINLSLSNLGTVIDCLVKGKPHIPFRSNPLTMLLKDSLGGNSKTCMFANLGPSEHNISETISTLRFADRAKQIKNKPIVQLDVKDQKIQELMDQVHAMKEKLKMFEGAGVQGLEEELDDTKEKLGEAEVKLDNAEKSREADREEFLGRLQTTESERDELQKLVKELQLAVDTVKEEREMIEQQLANAHKRKKEWKQQLSVELGIGGDGGEGVGADGEQQQDDNIESVLTSIRDMRNTYIDPQVHESKISDIDSRRKNAEQEVAALNATVDALKQQLADVNVDFEQAKKKMDRLSEKLDREKESRRQMADADTSGTTGTGLSPGRSGASFRRPSMVDLKAAAQQQNASSAFDTKEFQQLTADLQSKEALITELREQLSSGKEVQMMTEEVERVKKAAEEQHKKLQQQLEELTASITASKEGDEPQDALLKKALIAKDAALKASLSHSTSLESRISELVNMRKSVAVGNVREIQSDLLQESGAMRTALAQDLEHVSSHRNKLLTLLTKKEGVQLTNDNFTEELEEISKENELLRSKASEQTSSAGHASELATLRAVLTDHKKAAEDAVKMSSLNTEELHRKIAELEEAVGKAQEEALDKFLQEHKKNKKRKKDGGGEDEADDDDDDDDDPLRTALSILQREKVSLTSEVHALSRELQAAKVDLALRGPALPPSSASTTIASGDEKLETSGFLHDDGSFEALRQECLRLRALLKGGGGGGGGGSSSPGSAGESPTAGGKSPSKPATSPHAASGDGAGDTTGAGAGFDMDLQASFVEMEQNIQNQVNTAHLEASELRDELEALKGELDEANDRRGAAIKDRTAAQTEVADLKQQVLQLNQTLEDSKSRITALEEESQKTKTQLEQQYGTQVQSLEGRLHDYTEQLAAQQKLVEKQTSISTHLKERADHLNEELEKQAQEATKREEKLHEQLEHQEASFQRLVTRRLEEQKEQHQKNLIRKDDENHALRKQMKKLEDLLDKVRQEYDEKVCEYEELYSVMEETKAEALKNFMGGGGGGGGRSSRNKGRRVEEAVQMEHANEGREQVEDALQAAREARKRKKDAFATGEIVGVHARAAGSGTSRAKEKRGGGPSTPPSEAGSAIPIVPDYSHIPSASQSARPQRVVVPSHTGGGSGYTGYVAPAPPISPTLPLAPLPPPGSKPTAGRPPGPFGGTIGGGGGGPGGAGSGQGGGDDDMYYF